MLVLDYFFLDDLFLLSSGLFFLRAAVSPVVFVWVHVKVIFWWRINIHSSFLLRLLFRLKRSFFPFRKNINKLLLILTGTVIIFIQRLALFLLVLIPTVTFVIKLNRVRVGAFIFRVIFKIIIVLFIFICKFNCFLLRLLLLKVIKKMWKLINAGLAILNS